MSSALLSALGAKGVRKTLAKGWKQSVSFGLKCDLANLPPRREAKVPLVLVPADSADEAGLTAEVTRDSTNLEAVSRVALCAGGVRQLYVARDPEGKPCYIQWLVEPESHAALEHMHPGLFPRPDPGQVLLEGAYTFTDARGLGAMADGMHQLLELARDRGATEAITYVASDYPPAIRGCEKVGFQLDHARVSNRRLFWRSLRFVQPDPVALERWSEAVAERPK